MLPAIRRLQMRHVRIPLKGTIRHASQTRTETDSLVVSCELADGTTGWGEGLPRPYVTGETIDTAWELLSQLSLQPVLGGTFRDLDEVVDRLLEWAPLHVAADGRTSFGHSLRCAIELAVLDACCRSARQPLYGLAQLPAVARWLARPGSDSQGSTGPAAGGGTSAGGSQRPLQIRYGVPFTALGRMQQIVRAIKIRYFGFRDAKVKVGVPGIDDRETLRRLRFWLSPRFDLRVDGNEAWSPGDLSRRLNELAFAHLSSVEQPIPHRHLTALVGTRDQWPIPIMLDESLCCRHDAELAIADRVCAAFNLRLSKCGGFLQTIELAGMAAAAGLWCQLGCQVGETGILSAAGRHLATIVPDLRYHEGSYDRFLVKERLTVEDLTFGRGGWAPVLDGPGLGITVDPAAVAAVTIRQHEVVIE